MLTNKRKRRSGLPQERGVRRREKLKAAALSLLEHRGFQDVTFQSIADEAEVPLASCYNFYRSKLDLVRSLADELTNAYLEVVTDARLYSDTKNWQECISTFVTVGAAHHSRSIAELQIFFSGDVPRILRHDALEREVNIGIELQNILSSRFSLPAIIDQNKVFFRAIEIGRSVLTLEYMQTGSLSDTAATEAARAINGYLSSYIPPVLPPAPWSPGRGAERGSDASA